MAIAVSNKWKQAIQGQFRYPAYIRFVLSIQPPGLREGAQVSTDATESITNTRAMLDGISDPIEPVATLERNRWLGDGSMYLPAKTPSLNKPMEWWSNSCQFESVDLTFTFDKVYSIPGIYAVWDSETDSWPTRLRVTGYKQDGSTIGSYDITSIDSSEYYFDAAFDNVKAVKLSILEWSKPGWRVRINEIVFGLYLKFDNVKIPKATLAATSDLLASELPRLGIKFNIHNYDQTFDPTLKTGYAKYLAVRQRVDIAWGFNVDGKNVEWMEPWPLYLSAWDIPANSPEVSLATVSRLSFLTQQYAKGTYDGNARSFKTVALRVLQSSGIIQNMDGENPWELDPILDTLYTRAPEPIEPANAVLQLIANATGCILDNNPVNNFVRFRSATSPGGYTITKLQQLGDPAFPIHDRLKSVHVGIHTFKQRSEVTRVYTFEGHVSGSRVLDARYNSNEIVVNPSISVTGATITSQTYYARGAVITIVAPASGADVSVGIDGTIVDESTTLLQTYDNPDVASGLEIVIDNPLVTEIATVNRVAEVAENYYLRRRYVKAPYIGYPELEVGDTLEFSTRYGDFNADVTKLTMDFNGGFTGSIEAIIREEG